jgi:hypothetical protein
LSGQICCCASKKEEEEQQNKRRLYQVVFHCLPMSLTWACQLLVRSGLLLCFPKKKNKIKRRLYPVVFHCITGVPQSSTSQVGLEEPKVKPTDENHR